MSVLDLNQKVYLQVLTGRILGKYILRDLNKVGFITLNNTLCTALAASTEASFIENSNGLIKHFIYEEKETDIISEIKKSKLQTTVILLDGETNKDRLTEITKDLLKEFSENSIETDIILNEKIYSCGSLTNALTNKKIASYLSIMNNIFLYSFDLKNGFLIFYSIETGNSQIQLKEVEKYGLTFEHTNLLIKNSEIKQ